MSEKLVLVDVGSIAYRSLYAYKELSYDGTTTAAYYGVLKTVLSLKKEFGNRLVFCWDYGLPGSEPKPNWRNAIFPAYKSKRGEKDELALRMLATLPALHAILCDLGYESVGVAGLEADDLIGILAYSTTKKVLIYSSDRDMFQLLEKSRVEIIDPHKDVGKFTIRTQPQVERDYSIPITRWSQFLALGGDSSDDIHVMPGVGPKTALRMVRMGANLDKDFSGQPKHVREAFRKAEEYWPQFQAAYKVASIPRYEDDVRLGNYLANTKLPDVTKYRRIVKPNALKTFSTFCADFGLLEFFARRTEFIK